MDLSHKKSLMAANYHGRYFRVLVTRDVLEDVSKGLKWYEVPEFT